MPQLNKNQHPAGAGPVKTQYLYPLPDTMPATATDEHVDSAPLVPGVKPVLELLRADPGRVDALFIRKGRRDKNTDEILDLCRAHKVRFSLLDEKALIRLYSGKSQGVLARLVSTPFAELPDLLEAARNAPLPMALALDQVLDPGNAGTLCRSLYALGGGGLVIPRHNAAYLGPAASKAAAGALEKLPVAKVTNLAQALDAAEEAGFTLYGASTDPMAPDLFTLSPQFPALLALGGEEAGLRPIIAKRCQLIRIPMLRPFDSLNVAQAGSIMLAWLAHCKMKS